MIEGFKIDMTAEEILGHLEVRIHFFAITSLRMKSIGSVNQISDFSNWARVATVE